MEAQQMNLNTIANNLANVNTTGFKKNKIEFQDTLYQRKREVGAEQGYRKPHARFGGSRKWHTRLSPPQKFILKASSPKPAKKWTLPFKVMVFLRFNARIAARPPTRVMAVSSSAQMVVS
jgi:hypothetical protein